MIGPVVRCIPAVLAAFGAPAAFAQTAQSVAGAWFDSVGNEVGISSRSFSYSRLIPGERDVDDIIKLFNEACLRVAVGTEEVRPAVQSRQDWKFRYLDVNAATSSGARLDGWQAADVSVTSSARAWPLAECNVLANRKALEPSSPVVLILSAKLGRQPDKQYQTRSADGRPMQGQSFRWSAPGPAGQPRRIYASSYVDQNGAFAQHLGLTEARPK